MLHITASALLHKVYGFFSGAELDSLVPLKGDFGQVHASYFVEAVWGRPLPVGSSVKRCLLDLAHFTHLYNNFVTNNKALMQ